MSVPKSSQFSAERVAGTIRDRLNPIRGLTPELLVTHLQGWRAGRLRPLALLMDEVEDRDMVLKNVVSKRKRCSSRCEWEIQTEDDSPEAEAQKEFLEDFYARIGASSVLEADQRGGVSLLLRQMMDAMGKRYSVHEIVWRPDAGGSLTADLIWAPLWFFEARTGRLRFLTQDHHMDGVPMEENGWLVTVGDGLMVASVIAYLAKDFGLKDWLNASEKFGTPIIDAATDAAVGSPEWEALKEAVEAFATDGAIVRNRNAVISLLESKVTGSMPQPPLVEYIDRALASLWRGGDLSTISAGSGQGQGASLQGGESADLLEDDCEVLSETLQLRLDLPALQWKFGADVKPLAYFCLQPPPRTDTARELAIDAFLLGKIPLGVADTLKRYNRPRPGPDDELLAVPAIPSAGPPNATPLIPGREGASPLVASPADPASPPQDAAIIANVAATQREAIRAAFAEDMRPVADRLRAILSIEDPAIFAEKLAAFRAEIPSLLASVNADPQAARELEQMMAAAMLDGLASARRPG